VFLCQNVAATLRWRIHALLIFRDSDNRTASEISEVFRSFVAHCDIDLSGVLPAGGPATVPYYESDRSPSPGIERQPPYPATPLFNLRNFRHSRRKKMINNCSHIKTRRP